MEKKMETTIVNSGFAALHFAYFQALLPGIEISLSKQAPGKGNFVLRTLKKTFQALQHQPYCALWLLRRHMRSHAFPSATVMGQRGKLDQELAV